MDYFKVKHIQSFEFNIRLLGVFVLLFLDRIDQNNKIRVYS